MVNLYNKKYIDREKSWLNFNARVLQEAADENVPLLDRLRFLGIFSNNLDEFFRVRFAAIRRLSLTNHAEQKLISGCTAKQLVKDITEIAIVQQAESLRILGIIEEKLEKNNIFMICESDLTKDQEVFVKDLFVQKVSPALVTIILNDLAEFPVLKDTSGYLAVKLVMKSDKESKKEIRYAVIEIPKSINRFVVLPSLNENQYIIMLDDVIRFNLESIFNIFDFETVTAHMIKITRDAQLEIDSDLSKSMIEKISVSVKRATCW